MRIDRIQIKNFKLFVEQEFGFDPSFNLIIGVNGRGKTSLLRAIAVALGGWAYAYIKTNDLKSRRPIESDEVRVVLADNRYDRSKSVRVEAWFTGTVIDENLELKPASEVHLTRATDERAKETSISAGVRYASRGTEYNFMLLKQGSKVLARLERSRDFTLPLIAFYECDRLWKAEKQIDNAASMQATPSRFAPYEDCFHTPANHTAIGEWLVKQELASLQQGKPTDILVALQQAAKNAIEGLSGLRLDIDAGRVVAQFEDGRQVLFEHLSDGQRTMLGLFCDIARRATILNPHLKDQALVETPGVVLVDELDLHLHPLWQRQIIPALRTTFPKLQFICTTHSPFLIQSLREGRLVKLDSSDAGQVPVADQYDDQSIEDIVENVQGVKLPQKSRRYIDMMEAAKKYYSLLREGRPDGDEQLQRLKLELDALSMPYSDDPAFQAMLELERVATIGDRT